MILFRPPKGYMYENLENLHFTIFSRSIHKVSPGFEEVFTPTHFARSVFAPVGVLAKRLLGSGPIFVL